MTDIVPSEDIENIVGTYRREHSHVGRAVSSTQTFYILHSKDCLRTYDDLRDCPYSVALDNGIDTPRFLDRPGYLLLSENGFELVEFF